MRLRSLEIKGFKSFARETVLHFREDVIGVVGPNGSGKSNIVDAIRWVLGEQKKGELRLDKMSSVIFNGTKKRKAGNVAQVFLTFDNDRGVRRSDFHTVTIGRLLYRNGDSEYRLNGVACRRKDITDLFVDTGIESNSYAIIALGMVDDILADKDNSRLRMLEQAAGISVYKVRKKETLSRLRRTQDDLDRVEDLLHEIDGQLGSLEKQARRAKKHRALRESYRELSLDYAYLASEQLHEQRRGLDLELARAAAFAKTKAAERDALDVELEAARAEQLTEEQHLAEQRRQMGSIQAKLRTAISDRQLAEQKRDYLTQNLDKLRERRGGASAEQKRLEELFNVRSDRLAAAEDAEAAFARTLQDRRAALDAEQARTGELRGDVRARAEALQAAERALLATDKALAVAESRRDALRQEAAVRARSATEDERQRSALAAEHDRATATVEGLRERLRSAEEEEATRVVREQRLRDQLDQLAPQLRDRLARRQQYEHEAALLQGVLDRLEGSSEADKYLALRHGWRGVHPILGELLEVQPEFRPAVEAALSEVLGSFVVPDAATAAEGLRVLAEAGKPVTTILYIGALDEDAAAPTAPAPDALPLPPEARPLLSVVTAPAPYRPLLTRLLAEVYVLPDRPTTPPRGRACVIDGGGREQWTAYSARGGAVSKLLGRQTGRKQRLRDLRAHVEGAAAQFAALDAQRAQTEAQLQHVKSSGGSGDLRDLRRRVGEAERAAATAAANSEAALRRAAERDAADAATAAALEEVLAKALLLKDQRAPLLAERDALRAAALEGENLTDAAAGQLAAASAAYNEANMAAIKLQNATVAAARERDYAAQQLEEVERVLAESAAALDADGSEVEGISERLRALEDRISAGQATRDEHDERLRARERAFYARRDALTDGERRLRRLQQESNDAQQLLVGLRERRSEVKFRLEALAERLRIEFNLDLDEAVAETREVTTPLPELERELSRRKNRLDNYGEINPLAVEAFDAMAERQRGITTQRDDIRTAMDDLRETVAEIDASATEQLLAAFAAVREHFVEVFRHLFDAEDTADMVMVNPEHPLESKIEIVAKPKGKRPQTISQLSGGEKTLTATAFLFALYLIKPAPFCIFDEVDAPLDDSNVEKFNRIIKRFAGQSQFIIVTHNKLTMAAVDTIYGVFMPELGVSQVAPVDFRQFEHTDLAELVG